MEKNDLIRKIIKEALGVPENIHETSERLFKRILAFIKTLDETDFETDSAIDTKFRGNYRIADYNFSTIKIRLGVDEVPKVKKPEIISMVARTESKKTEDYRLEHIKTKTVDIVFVIIVPVNYDYSQFPAFFESQRNEIVKNLSHELKHSYDHFKKEYENPTRRAEYNAAIGHGFNIWPLDRFLHDLYYISATENLVRPSEVASAIRNNQISQKDFLNFLMNDETYKNLKRISQFSLEKLKDELKNEIKSVDKFLKGVGLKPSKMSEEEKINEILRIVYVNLSNWKIQEFAEILKTSFVEEILGFEDEKEKVFQKFISRSQKFKENYEDFYRFHEKQFHFVAEKMLRKIAKLYDITHKK